MIKKIIERLEEEYIEVKDDNDLYNNRAIFKAISIVRQVAEENSNCTGCCFYDGGYINKHENYDSLIPNKN